jgi:hypothetical protein
MSWLKNIIFIIYCYGGKESPVIYNCDNNNKLIITIIFIYLKIFISVDAAKGVVVEE